MLGTMSVKMTMKKLLKHGVRGLYGILFAAVAEAVPATDSGTYFIANGKPQVNENVIRSGKNNKGNIEFIGYATFDLSGDGAEQLKEGGALSANLKVFSGKPSELIIEYLGTFASGDLDVKSASTWTSAAAKVSLTHSTEKESFTAIMTLPADSLVRDFAVFRFRNTKRGSQWDISAPTFPVANDAAAQTPPKTFCFSRSIRGCGCALSESDP